MVKKSQERTGILILTICLSSLLMLPKTMAYIRSDGASDYEDKYKFVDNQKSRSTKQHIGPRDTENDLLEIIYSDDPEYDSKSEELPALIVDYANMIRNDIILLDNSVETRTRKRGNIMVEKFSVPHNSCSCESAPKRTFNLGLNYYPSQLHYANCKNTSNRLYKCRNKLYNQTLLIQKPFNEDPPWELPEDLTQYLVEHTIMERQWIGHEAWRVGLPDNSYRHRWMAIRIPVVVCCISETDYIERNKY